MTDARTGRVAVITGAARGLGSAIASEFASGDTQVVLAGAPFDSAARHAEVLRGRGLTAAAVDTDVTVPEEVERLIERSQELFGRLDVLVNNAGVGAIGPSESLPLDVWRRTIDVNLTGAFLCAQAAGRVMLEQGRGVIINVASIFGVVGMPQRAAYVASKHGLVGLTKVLGVEWAPRGIRVVGVNPSYVRTDLDTVDQGAGDYRDVDVERRTPQGRFATAEEVARAVVWLASDAASFVNGTSLDVDGGWLAYGGW